MTNISAATSPMKAIGRMKSRGFKVGWLIVEGGVALGGATVGFIVEDDVGFIVGIGVVTLSPTATQLLVVNGEVALISAVSAHIVTIIFRTLPG